ncbi:MAG TPA: methionine synthase, partial [Myxococcota bacterium]|nr:methionine synthase [Myxococcota bacterium]
GAGRIDASAMKDLVGELNREAARLARNAADAFSTPGRRRFVAGSIGPTNKTASLSPDVNDPSFRAVTFEDLRAAYYAQVEGLVAGGVDLLMPETSFDTLNLKACLFAIEEFFQNTGKRLPVFASVTITDRSGRTLSGQTVEAFWNSIAHANLFAVGINCALGASDMRPYIEELSRVSPTRVFCYPNAGLPNAMGGYDETPGSMGAVLKEYAQEGWLNMVGGCCGTGPEHIRAIAEAVSRFSPREMPTIAPYSRYSGLEAVTVRPDSNLVMVGERTNVTGSRKFARLIKENRYEEALSVARSQVEGGANVLDVNMDEGLLDSEAVMTRFLNQLGSEPDIAKLPIMVDSSKFTVLEAGLRCLQGKSIVNSISLKGGEAEFLRQAELVRRYGAAVVVMAFDEEGQAVDCARRVEICHRAYRLLTEKVGFKPEDIIFDVNILTVGTGIAEHSTYALSFLEAVRQLKKELPLCRYSGGVSNVSFAFRGNDRVREAMHAAFLYHAIQAGLDMAIVNAGQLAVYEQIEPELLERVEDVLFNRREDATERLIEWGNAHSGTVKTEVEALAWRSLPLEDRIVHALLHGDASFVEADMDEALQHYAAPLLIIEGPLMAGMNHVGDLFGAGKMFLPQVVKSARVMKKAVARLEPYFQRAAGSTQGRILMATVKGDVHDIGKNIVGVVLG